MEAIKKNGRITISDVASHAGVSRAAIYAVIGGKETNIGVSETTRNRVLSAIASLGYIPNESARTLASGRSKSIGMVLQNSETEVARLLTEAVTEIFSQHGFMVITTYSASNPDKERAILKSFFAKNIGGLIIARINPEFNADMLEQFDNAGIPVINIARARDVAFDEPAVMVLTTGHLAECGITRIGFLSYAGKLVFSGQERLHYLQNALKFHPEMKIVSIAEAGNYADCRAYAEKLKNTNPADRPQAIICYNDKLAGGLLHNLLEIGLRVPEDIGLVGVDGYADPFLPLALTTIRLPVDKLAQAIWSIYKKERQVNNPELIAPELILGATTRVRKDH